MVGDIQMPSVVNEIKIFISEFPWYYTYQPVTTYLNIYGQVLGS